jgi:hypothetical protein
MRNTQIIHVAKAHVYQNTLPSKRQLLRQHLNVTDKCFSISSMLQEGSQRWASSCEAPTPRRRGRRCGVQEYQLPSDEEDKTEGGKEEDGREDGEHDSGSARATKRMGPKVMMMSRCVCGLCACCGGRGTGQGASHWGEWYRGDIRSACYVLTEVAIRPRSEYVCAAR